MMEDKGQTVILWIRVRVLASIEDQQCQNRQKDGLIRGS